MTDKEILKVINGLPVHESAGGDMPYMLVENIPKHISKLEAVGITQDTVNKYGNSEYFCILALALGEGYADGFSEGGFFKNDFERDLNHLNECFDAYGPGVSISNGHLTSFEYDNEELNESVRLIGKHYQKVMQIYDDMLQRSFTKEIESLNDSE